MTCREVIDFIQRYLDGELTPDERTAFEHHLALCDECTEYLQNYQQTVAMGQAALRTEPQPAIPEGLMKAVLEALRAGERGA